MIRKYGKSFQDIANIKSSFFTENKKLLDTNIKMAEIYRMQPKRTKCKNCDRLLPEEIYFTKQDIDYYLCVTCNHINGAYEDTNQFASAIYVEEVTDYSKVYAELDLDNYINRVDKVYKPKAEFLIECLQHLEIDYLEKSYTDLGAGSGYFVYALNKMLNVKNVNGYEVSSKQVEIGNKILKKDIISNIGIDELKNTINETKSDVISMIGVLEHLTNPREILSSIQENTNIEFFYISLPLFSYSVFFELINQDIYNRHLSGGHTHLYTKESIRFFCEEFGFDIVGEWQFGTDVMDLYRFMSVSMDKIEVGTEAKSLFTEKFLSVLDGLQSVMDKSHFSSETHVLLRKKQLIKVSKNN